MSADISYSRYLVNRFIIQLLDGCESQVCSNRACHSGRCNTSSGEPVRRYTPRSARAIALVLAAEPDPESLLCEHEALAWVWSEGKQDPSDLVQLMADTETVKDFLSGNFHKEQFATDPTLQELHKSLDVYQAFYERLITQQDLTHQCESSPRPPVFELACLSCRCLTFLCDRLPILPFRTLDVAILAQSQGFNVPIGNENCEAIQAWLDALSHEPSQRLCSRLLFEIGRMGKLLHTPGSLVKQTDVIHVILHKENGWLVQDDYERLQVQAFYTTALLQRTFLAHWDGASIIEFGSVEDAALQFLEELAASYIEQLGTYEWLAVIPKHFRPDSVTMAESWLRYNSSPHRGHFRHLLSFKCVFTQEERSRIFRAVLHLRQRTAHSKAEMASALRRRLQPHVDEPETWRQRYHERHYFVLNVRRANILKDTFDQMWQRRRSELSLPLRVRLGEMEALEIGHDLGGVQIEFFNLICKEAFSEDGQLFVTDPDSGYHYFRPMSLEPLWRFEQFGVLFAVAIINGITLPVNFPRVFYGHLLSGDILNLLMKRQATAHPLSSSFEWIQDGWPVVHKSISAYLEHPIDLEYAFPLEANGLLATALAGPETIVTGRRSLKLYDPTHLNSSKRLDGDSDIADQWPGWTIQVMAEEAKEVTADERQNYLFDYVKWMTTHSVWPQLIAFQRGFFSLVDRSDLEIICPLSLTSNVTMADATALKLYIEGTPHVDLTALRRTTAYENYSLSDPYIQSFWAMLDRWPAGKVKKLVKFVTAAERLPLNMGSFKFVIKRGGMSAPGLLPTSSTCFSTLSLPQYSSAVELEEKLTLALEFGLEGFGAG